MKAILNRINNFFKDRVERSTFGVIDYVSSKFGVASSKMRLYFIYTSFLTLGSPLILYVIVLFWINLKNFIRSSYTHIFE